MSYWHLIDFVVSCLSGTDFELAEVLCGLNSVVFYYINQKGTRTAEFMEFSATGKVARVVSNYAM